MANDIDKRIIKRKQENGTLQEVYVKTSADMVVRNNSTIDADLTSAEKKITDLETAIGGGEGGVVTVVKTINNEAPDGKGNVELTPDDIGAEPALSTNKTAGTYAKVTIDNKGLVTAGAKLAAGDIPDISATYIKTDRIGAANGVASLDSKGNIPLDQLGNLDTTIFVVVTELPARPKVGDENKIHLVPKSGTPAEEKNGYTEYVWKTDAWEKIGDTKLDLSGYQTKTLEQAISVNGVSKTTVQDSLNALATLSNTNKSNIDKVVDGTTVIKKAEIVTTNIKNQAIADIFETDTTTTGNITATVKNATNAANAAKLNANGKIGDRNVTDIFDGNTAKVQSAKAADTAIALATGITFNTTTTGDDIIPVTSASTTLNGNVDIKVDLKKRFDQNGAGQAAVVNTKGIVTGFMNTIEFSDTPVTNSNTLIPGGLLFEKVQS